MGRRGKERGETEKEKKEKGGRERQRVPLQNDR